MMALAKEDEFAFNRTIVELKLSFVRCGDNGEGAFNRTIVELKLQVVEAFICFNLLLIEPLWN